MPRARADARTGHAGRDGVPRLRTVQRFDLHVALRRGGLRQAAGGIAARDGHHCGHAGALARLHGAERGAARRPRVSRARRGRPDARHGVFAASAAHHPEVTEEASDLVFLGNHAGGDRIAGQVCRQRSGEDRDWYAHVASGDGDARLLSGGDGPEIRIAVRIDGENKLRLCVGVLPDERRGGPHRAPAQEGEPLGGCVAFEPHATRARGGARGIQERTLRSAGGDGYRGARAGYRGGFACDQLRHSRASGRLRAPHRSHGAGAGRGRCLHARDRGGSGHDRIDRTVHRDENPAVEAGRL